MSLSMLLSLKGRTRIKIANPNLEGPPEPSSASNLRLQKHLTQPLSTSKSVATSGSSSPLGNFSVGRFDNSIPGNFNANLSKVISANPNLNLPGKNPGVRGGSVTVRL